MVHLSARACRIVLVAPRGGINLGRAQAASRGPVPALSSAETALAIGERLLRCRGIATRW